MRTLPTLLLGATALFASETVSAADVVTGWTDTFCETIQTLTQTTGGPCRTSRSGAMMYLAMYDAVNCITKARQPYLVDLPASSSASKEAAATAAAYEILMELYPTRAYLFNPRYAQDLALIPEGPAKDEGIALGAAVAAAILADRTGDGAGDPVQYEGVDAPGHWRPTWPEYRPAKDPGYGRVRPFGLLAQDQFPREEPPTIDSPEYFEAWDEVRRIGEQHANQEGTIEWEIGWFWANDQDGSFKANGHIYQLTKAAADAAGLGFEDRVHLFALMGIATADAAISAWYSKYETPWDLWRPVTGIREADTDGNPLTEPDLGWVPVAYNTPNFPAYVSGHACFAGASSQLLRRYFGTDEMEFVVPTTDPHLTPGWTRTMYSFSQAENENADSRIYIGVHWRFDCDEALLMGHQIGDWTFDNFLGPIDGAVSALPESQALVRLDALYPNPTAGPATLRFATITPGSLGAAIYDANGRQVGTLAPREVAAGSVELHWDGRGEGGRLVAPGVYFVRGTLDGAPLTQLGSETRVIVLR